MYQQAPLPREIPMYGAARYKNIMFPDCFETSLRNVINALIYEPTTQTFDLNILKSLIGGDAHTSEEVPTKLLAFYTKYHTTENIITPQSYHDWAEVMSDISGVTYKRKSRCEIIGGYPNMLRVLQALFPGIRGLDDIAQRLSPMGIKLQVQLTESGAHYYCTLEITRQKEHAARPIAITWQLQDQHGETHFPVEQEHVPAWNYAFQDLQAEEHGSCVKLFFASLFSSLGGVIEPYFDPRPIRPYRLTDPALYCLPCAKDIFNASFFVADSNLALQDKMLFISALIERASSTIGSVNDILETIKLRSKDFGLGDDFIVKLSQHILLSPVNRHNQALVILFILKYMNHFPALIDWFCDNRVLDMVKDRLEKMRCMVILSRLDCRDCVITTRMADTIARWFDHPGTYSGLADDRDQFMWFIGVLLDVRHAQTPAFFSQQIYPSLVKHVSKILGSLNLSKEELANFIEGLVSMTGIEVLPSSLASQFLPVLFTYVLSGENRKKIEAFDQGTQEALLDGVQRRTRNFYASPENARFLENLMMLLED